MFRQGCFLCALLHCNQVAHTKGQRGRLLAPTSSLMPTSLLNTMALCPPSTLKRLLEAA